MAIKIIEQRTCDWCGTDEDTDSIKTHRLVFDKLAREVELHTACIEDASLSYLLEHGRRPTAEQIKAASAPTMNDAQRLPCPVDGCTKKGKGVMGLAQHMAQMHKDIPTSERQTLVQSTKENQT